MPNRPTTPKIHVQNNQPEPPKNRWERHYKQAPNPHQNLRQSHIPMGMGKHRKSFGHV